MKKQAIEIEEKRLEGIQSIEEFPDFHERHRIFPAVFENRQHKKILDIAAGVGCAAQRIHEKYPAELLCNDITPTCLRILKKLGLATVSFDLDDAEQAFPFADGSLDTIVCLATIEHMVNIDHFVQEIRRILSDDGYLYMSTPNYASLEFLPQYIFKGRSFHDPLSKSSRQRYEFYAHVRYLTYRTMIEYVSSFGFVLDTVYLALPGGSKRYLASSRIKRIAYRSLMFLMYQLLSPRWAAEPVVCFRKVSADAKNKSRAKIRKVVL
jgi:2-polyprenyl-3-methyl-5-hydroxy-6-metoxy-1,4-benzoquinol methylase